MKYKLIFLWIHLYWEQTSFLRGWCTIQSSDLKVEGGLLTGSEGGVSDKINLTDCGECAAFVQCSAYREETSHHTHRSRPSVSSVFYHTLYYLGISMFSDLLGKVIR